MTIRMDLSDIRERVRGSDYYQRRGGYRLGKVRKNGFRWMPCSSCGRDYQKPFSFTRGIDWPGPGGKGRCMPCEAGSLLARSLAHQMVARAIKQGSLRRPAGQSCVDCGKPAQVLDHRDYELPLVVDPVCKTCDRQRGAGEPFVTRLRIVK